mmetsp:Transcript_30124/g.86236  ORF Transcript_30124/g.86236 Transcript_30124/m.86236 type:complete len:889 (-) Transcript_30124:147-2813(-)
MADSHYQEGYGAVPSDHYASGYGPPGGDYGGYGGDPGGYAPVTPGGYGPGPQEYGDYPQYEGTHPGDVSGLDGNADDYQQYTERKGALSTIDPENGIAPRRCTDCVCLFVFLAYVAGMILLVNVCRDSTIGDRQWSDIRRLTHGHDYTGRLCGVDEDVTDKPFLYWCRTNWTETGSVPTTLNLDYPSCVKTCPTADGKVVPSIRCLFNLTYNEMSLTPKPGSGVEPFGTIATYHLQFQQSEAETPPYDTEPFGGRFCTPVDQTMKEKVETGPLRHVRFFVSVGSLQDPWLVLFQASLISIVLGYVYVFLIFECPRIFTISFLYATWALLTVSGGFFFYAVVGLLVNQGGKEALKTTFKWDAYTEYNPFFEEHSPETSILISVVVAAVLWCIGCGILGTITHVAGDGFMYVADLVDAAKECSMQMKSMLVPPGIEAIFKFVMMWTLGYNFMYLMSVGFYEDRRLMVNGQKFKDATAVYHFDTSIIPWMVYYLFGCVWLMELITSCGQFLVSFAVISWYFMKKEGHVKTGVPPLPPLHGAITGVMFHAGSLCLGAAVHPWIRLIRLFNWIEDESVPDKEARCCPEGQENCVANCTNAICQCVGGLCSKVTEARKRCFTPPQCLPSPDPKHGHRSDGLMNPGCSYRYSKNAYNDVIIRSQHYLQASQRAFRLIHKYQSTREHMLLGNGCQVVTVVGVMSIAIIGTIFTHLSIMSNSALTNPASPSFIAEPMFIDALAFLLCANIAYGFMMIFDHTADTLLYCYAWNKKFSQDSGGHPVEDYLPESMRDLVDLDVEDDDEKGALYGKARPEMYLGTFFTSRRAQIKADKDKDKARQSQIQMTTATMGAANAGASSMSGASRQFGGFATGTSQVPYQAVASGGYTPSAAYHYS